MHSAETLAPFHPAVRGWFESTHAAPTPVQAASWPRIAAGAHVLITAPTGSGKTLTAFLCCINRFCTGEWATGRTRVLYISPLKALNNDIRVNLTEPLSALQHDWGISSIRTGVRSGDTSPGDRQRLLRSPPDILITTPESLHLMLTTLKGRAALAGIECVIIDEIHALVDNRRGAQLAVALERLVNIAGEFQRIALSATVNPLEAVATWISGRDADGVPRPMEIISSDAAKRIELTVRFPQSAQQAAANGQKIWDPLAVEFRDIIARNRSTLFFTNSRRLAERITLKINEAVDEPLAFAHHGSLARDIRTEVEQRLKQGDLRAIVATSSLEMGIDIGALDEVVMVQTPPSVAATLQRIGRAGHVVGATSVGTLFPSHSHDLLMAAVLAGAVRDRDIEPIHLIHNPLDILVQVIISICATETWNIDRLYGLIIRATVYHQLDRALFDLVLDMLTGRFAGSRLRDLKPRLLLDHERQTVSVAKGALYALYASGGSIPDRGYYKLRAQSGEPIGELDEEFVWEATLGQTFTLGTQAWTIQRITHNDVFVKPATNRDKATPFWRSETILRGNHLSARIGDFLRQAEARLEVREFAELARELTALGLDEPGAAALLAYLRNQRETTGAPLPHRQHLLVERAAGGPDGYRGPDAPKQLILHTFWGGALNQPFALALKAALADSGIGKADVHADDDAVVIQCRDWPDSAAVMGLVNTGNLDRLLRQSLENSGLFGARFRESAQRSLLLARPRFNQRLPLWMSRLQAKKLLTGVKRYDNFPALLEAWRTCLEDEFDLAALRNRLDELHDGEITWTEVHTAAPSPFAAHLRFDQISTYMYAGDDPEEPGASRLSQDLIDNAIRNPALRPQLSPEVIRAFEAKRQRTAPGYLPGNIDDLVELTRDRIAIPGEEWNRLLDLAGIASFDHPLLDKVRRGERWWQVHRDFVDTLERRPGDSGTGFELHQLCIEMLSFYGPRTSLEFAVLLPDVPDGLWDDERLARDVCIEGQERSCLCERENLEILLRLQRARSRQPVEPRPVAHWPAFMARQHGLGLAPDTDREQLRLDVVDDLTRLSGCAAPVEAWLHDLVQARSGETGANLVGDILQAEGFCWRGAGRERVLVVPVDEAGLFIDLSATPDQETVALTAAFRDPDARYPFARLRDAHSSSPGEFNRLWWQAVWAGLIAADEWSVLRDASRRGYELGDLAPIAAGARTLRRRPRFAPLGWSGNWYVMAPAESPSPLQALELGRQTARILLDRYGVLCRELVVREGLSWSGCFRALRIMELAGEVTGGLFFEGLSGPQFATPAAVHRLRQVAVDRAWWVNAVDPASPCGLGLDWPGLPRRMANNWLSFAGSDLILVVEHGGKSLRFDVAPEDPRLPGALELIRHLLATRGRLELTRINQLPAIDSPYLAVLGAGFTLHRDHRTVELDLR